MMETIEETYEYFYALTFPKRNVDNFFSNDKFESFKKIEEFNFGQEMQFMEIAEAFLCSQGVKQGSSKGRHSDGKTRRKHP